MLINGIIPMNNKGIIHNDIKSDNIVYDNKNIRLIDWGEVFIKSKKNLYFNQVIQFNLPFSNILFSRNFSKWYSKQLIVLKNKSSNITFNNYKNIAIKWINYILELEGSHFDFIVSIFKNILPTKLDNDIIEYVVGYIASYIANIFKKYTNLSNNSINIHKYYQEVYIKNIDIWGFLTFYIDMVFVYNRTPKKFNMRDTEKSELINKIIDLLMKYLYSNNYSAAPINIKTLIVDLKSLNFKFYKQKSRKTRVKPRLSRKTRVNRDYRGKLG